MANLQFVLQGFQEVEDFGHQFRLLLFSNIYSIGKDNNYLSRTL